MESTTFNKHFACSMQVCTPGLKKLKLCEIQQNMYSRDKGKV